MGSQNRSDTVDDQTNPPIVIISILSDPFKSTNLLLWIRLVWTTPEQLTALFDYSSDKQVKETKLFDGDFVTISTRLLEMD